MTMLIRKQKCLARNSLGMLCHCQALSSGRCRFHSTFSAGPSIRKSTVSRHGEPVIGFGGWRELFVPSTARGLRQTPGAFNL